MFTDTGSSTHPPRPFPCGMEYTQDFNSTATNSIGQDIWEASYDKFTGPGNSTRPPHVWVIRKQRSAGV
jgi:hypothetical protein